MYRTDRFKEHSVASPVCAKIASASKHSIFYQNTQSTFCYSRQTYKVDIFLTQIWWDNRLRFPNNTADHDYHLLDVEWLKEIWLPGVYVKNALLTHLTPMPIPNQSVRLFSDRRIEYKMKLSLELSSDMYFGLYPHDAQNYSIEIATCKFLS